MTEAISVDQLRTFIQRIERMEEQRAEVASDIRDIYAEAKGAGWDVPTMKAIVKLRKLDASERDEKESLLDLYAGALGMRPAMEDAA